MYCPNCNSENNDSAKFCKKCGTPLKKEVSHKKIINSINDEKSSKDDITKYIIIALIIIAIALAGAFAYIGFGNHNDDGQTQVQNNASSSPNPVQSTQSSQPQQSSSAQSAAMDILGGSFSTGSSLSAKTYASIYVGSQHSGEKVIIQIKYSRDGSSLNNGNMVPKTVDSSGYINVKSADSFKYYPDFAEINLFDTNKNLLDTQSVSLSPDSSTQTF
ncbi:MULTISPECIES: zinc ribbon domain-containing protein [Methanobrevibacter]|uniref:Zinc ribbon protein n=1 Tax=Methanobrevibacter gottschalkii DSM 11977 TaxID=1122229 RepID=A0A3N5B3Y2_9EURY|nr:MULTISPECIES: zinc ribbon domain-containing protein [Methanobrevibacter]OEC94454.1 hypothetical protein A9505_08745 [Methanobrevibacter sp. A27]RPF52023.1 zinc ribbon protein [Methanobrevibacter gottschalkii DSM 11977]